MAAKLNAEHNTANSTFLRLPGEIRNKIYRCILERVEFRCYKGSGTDSAFLRVVRRQGKRWKTITRQFAFMMVCRQMYAETCLLPFRATTWSAISHMIHEHSDGPATLMYRKQFQDILRHFNREQIAAIENLEVQILMFQNLDSTATYYQEIGAGYELVLPCFIDENTRFPEKCFEALRNGDIALTGLRNITLVFTGIAALHVERIWHTALVGTLAFAGRCPKGFDVADKRYAFPGELGIKTNLGMYTWNVVL